MVKGILVPFQQEMGIYVLQLLQCLSLGLDPATLDGLDEVLLVGETLWGTWINARFSHLEYQQISFIAHVQHLYFLWSNGILGLSISLSFWALDGSKLKYALKGVNPASSSWDPTSTLSLYNGSVLEWR